MYNLKRTISIISTFLEDILLILSCVIPLRAMIIGYTIRTDSSIYFHYFRTTSTAIKSLSNCEYTFQNLKFKNNSYITSTLYANDISFPFIEWKFLSERVSRSRWKLISTYKCIIFLAICYTLDYCPSQTRRNDYFINLRFQADCHWTINGLRPKLPESSAF